MATTSTPSSTIRISVSMATTLKAGGKKLVHVCVCGQPKNYVRRLHCCCSSVVVIIATRPAHVQSNIYTKYIIYFILYAFQPRLTHRVSSRFSLPPLHVHKNYEWIYSHLLKCVQKWNSTISVVLRKNYVTYIIIIYIFVRDYYYRHLEHNKQPNWMRVPCLWTEKMSFFFSISGKVEKWSRKCGHCATINTHFSATIMDNGWPFCVLNEMR